MTPMPSTEIERAMWEGNIDKLDKLAGCICCCAEHTFESCPARAWHGCRGSDTLTRAEIEKWRSLYGMTEAEFYNYGRDVADAEH
jgi:hypothetical protein